MNEIAPPLCRPPCAGVLRKRYFYRFFHHFSEKRNRGIPTQVLLRENGVFCDWHVGLKSLSEKGLLHIGVVQAPLCNL